MNDDLISRQKAIDILDAYQVMVENGEENPYAWARLRMSELPSAQPEQRSFSCGQENDLISRRAAIDKLDPLFESLAIDKIKALPSAQPNLQPTCNQLATDCISRKVALDGIDDYLEEYDGIDENGNHDLKWCAMKEAELLIKDLPSAQPETNCSEFPNTSDFVSRKAVREMVATWSYDMEEWEDMELALHDVDELPPVSAERQGGKKNEGHF